ncbi:HEAT repeat domain-containing protein [Methanosarcina mazei]|uniref:Phosphorylase n=1 Tax=Methanosarcina mazei TaxID=2209 RepID=A0A0F8DV89_METMZ|nr:HEAT repeat domain-containing protein [Methanosarcina mazei]KKG32297.1 hypothetical protein DU30_00880 [Methanosarcina mazei]KKG64501.1 hypothetical protein DU67_07490 [Methanosarcina mazei]
MIDQEKIHNLCLSEDPKELIKALKQLKDNFSTLLDKEQALNDLIKLTTNKEKDVRSEVASAFSNILIFVPDKQRVWNCLINLTDDKSRDVRINAASTIGSAFVHMPDKQLAWNFLIKLANDKDMWVRYQAYSALSSIFIHISDKQQAWKDLIKLTEDEETLLRSRDVYAYNSMFVHMSDKHQEWKDSVKLSNDENNYTISSSFSRIGYLFSRIPDRHEVWDDLAKDNEGWVVSGVASALKSAFAYVPDKQEAWNDLIRLINSENKLASHRAASVLGYMFFYSLDKQQSWSDLHKFCNDEDSIVRSEVAFSLGFSFSHLPDKQQAWDDLDRLKNDGACRVRSYANYSLGKISIFKASQAEKEEDYKEELEKAITFFGKAAQESEYFNPSQFCLPFYLSFHTILFKRNEAKGEVDKHLAEARNAVKSSKSKDLLFEVVENLAKALEEVQNLENLDLEAKKGELNFYRKYCDRAAELMKETEDTAPYATAAVRKGLPILDRNLKGLLEEIQNKAKNACQESQGTPTQEIACEINREVQKWEIGSQEEMTQMIENLAYILEEKISVQPKNQYILGKIEQMKNERLLVRQYEILSQIIPLIRNVTVVPVEPILDEIKELIVSVDQLTASVDELQNPQEYLDIIQKDLKEIKDYMPGMKEKIDRVLYESYTPLSTTQKLKIAIPIIPSLVSYEQETEVPEFVAENIHELKNIFYKMKDSLKKLR